MNSLAEELTSVHVRPHRGFFGGYTLVDSATGNTYDLDCTISEVSPGRVMVKCTDRAAMWTGSMWVDVMKGQ